MVGRRRDSKQRATLSFRLDPCPWADNSQPTDSLGPCNLNSTVICKESRNRDQCTCSGVSYLLAAACQACVNLNSTQSLSWNDYSRLNNCPGDPASFPAPLPTGQHTIPTWALVLNNQNPLATTLDLALASSVAVNTIRSLAPSPTATNSTTSTSTTPPGSSATSESSDISNPSAPTSPPGAPLRGASKSTSNVGSIVGGIIGAVVVLALVGVGVCYTVKRRRRNHIAPSAAYKAAVRAGTPMPYQPVHHESPKNSTDDLRPERPGSWLPFEAVSIRSESRFLEHTS